jgi:hypothetical protein
MTATLDGRTGTAVDSVVAEAEELRRPRRRRLLVLAGLGAVVVLLAWASAPRWGVRIPSELGLRIGGEARVLTLPEFGVRGSYVLDYVDGADVAIDVPMHNDGVLGMTVTGVQLSEEPRPLLELVGVDRNVHVPAGGQALLSLRARLTNCAYYHEREVARYVSATVTYEVLGRQATRVVPLEHDLVVHAPMIVGCPNGKLDRSLLNRR